MSDKPSIDAPNFTQTPNILFDDLMADMKEGELRVALAIIRKTFGWHKDREVISLSQLEKMTGMSRQGVLNGIDDLIERGLVKRQKAGRGYSYELIVNEVDQSTKLTNKESTNLTSDSQLSRPKIVNEVDTQKKEEKKTIKESGKEKAADAADDDTSLRAGVIKLYDDNIGSLTPIVGQELHDLMDEYGEMAVKEAIEWAVKTNARKLSAVIGCAKKMAGEKTPAEKRKEATAAKEADASVTAYKQHAEKIQAAKSGKNPEMARIIETARSIVDNKLVETHLEHATVAFIDGKAIFTIPETASLVWLNTKANKAVLQAVRFSGHKDVTAVEFVAAGEKAVADAA